MITWMRKGGATMPCSTVLEVESNLKHGWEKFDPDKPQVDLIEQYKARFGKRPHHWMKEESIRKAVEE